jgi:ADP-ribosylglycohydrolase
MLGAIAGDIIGSVFEFNPTQRADFPLFTDESRFTDDTVLTAAVAFAIMTDGDYASAMRIFGRLYPLAGYGAMFREWLMSPVPKPYNSFGNGAAMRVCPIGFAFGSVPEVLAEAKRSAACTHNHPEGIKGAQAVALAVFLARQGEAKDTIKQEIVTRFGYDLSRTIAEIKPNYSFNETCQRTVPEALTAFLEGRDFEETIRLAVSLGGDADTLACIAGGIAHAFAGELPADVSRQVRARLPKDLLEIIDDFCAKYPTQE